MLDSPTMNRCVRGLLATLIVGLATLGAAAETFEGQIVCSNCWFEANRDEIAYGTAADLDCAARCAKQGIGPALAVRGDDGFELHAIGGDPPGGGPWLDWIGRYVRAEGRVDAGDGKPLLRLASLAPLAERPWPTAEREDHDEADVELTWFDLRGRPTGLESRRNRIVVINFWATWCKPCIAETPDLIRLHDAFAPYGVEFIGAAADDAEHAGVVVEYVRKHGINFPVVLGATSEQMESLGLPPALPATVVLDEHGHPVERFAGVIDPRKVESTLAGLIGQTRASPPEPRVAKVATRGHRHHSATSASLVPS